MKELKEKLEIEYLKSLTYTEINQKMNDLQAKITELSKDVQSLGDTNKHCLSHEETMQFFQFMSRWESSNLIDYSLMKGADWMQRTLAKRLNIKYEPK